MGRAQDYLADALSHLARAIGFMDSCGECDRRLELDKPDEWVNSSTPPYRTEIDGNTLHGRYRCAAGHEWTCGYALTTPGLF
ncbi:uncharacterized protein RMCC_5898 [Mycolicibacterium canariasense]|uniref:Uncharacterized protein n=1 Tax=Mycolicibacterium canariasense TaxID=228230 RepID=A0A100WJF2_MYCCR|nr:hypothetical protein [Mycolicibacterium canariasense]MCV7208393.1 hypothetical protein [Mycolicibacterium canariasense]ORV13575.1 hypothetical protein AWB94_04975 [Mycolicibacterium canariasense]GAS98933.1 uncharacterized protein RMCC_5898 [Mycolicibacterium canariasense]